MKKFILIVALMVSSSAYAAFHHLFGGKFIDNGIIINYPCSGGGEPLVIYSTPIQNKSVISSKDSVYPLYLKPGYEADPLTVGENTQSTQTSTQHFIIENPNPAYSNNFVRFNLQRSDKAFFYVDTINFASIDATTNERYVSAIKVLTDDQPFFTSITPVRMYAFNQDWGVYVFKKLKSITGYQFAWNQKGEWSHDFKDARYPVNYFFKTEQTKSLENTYNGFGFWICGSDQEPTIKAVQPKTAYFFDKIS